MLQQRQLSSQWQNESTKKNGERENRHDDSRALDWAQPQPRGLKAQGSKECTDPRDEKNNRNQDMRP